MASRNRHPVTRPETSNLSALERIALAGLIAREQHIQREVLAPLQAEYGAVGEAVALRLGLPADALQTTHEIDLGTMTVRERARIEPVPEPVPEPEMGD